MADQQMQKPVVFISHASTDGEFANAVKYEIEKVFTNGVGCGSSSSAAESVSAAARQEAIGSVTAW